jgi:hypothetical protein
MLSVIHKFVTKNRPYQNLVCTSWDETPQAGVSTANTDDDVKWLDGPHCRQENPCA